MLRLIYLVIGLTISTFTFANPIMCDGVKVEITFAKSVQYVDAVEAILVATIDSRSTTLRYDGNVDFIGAECRKTKRGKALIIFQAFCGGSACKDLDNFGIIDPKDLRILLVPNDSNHSLATQIFGADVAPIKEPLSVGDAYEKLFHK